MRGKDFLLQCLMVLSTVLYSLAAVSNAWFTLPPHSFYGLWYVEFCDFLQCQIIPAIFYEEPGWYHGLQLLSILAWLGLVVALLMLMLPHQVKKYLPSSMIFHQRAIIAGTCIVSALAILSSLIIFYRKLFESSGVHPHVSWSSVLAAISCAGDFAVGLLLLKS